MTVTASAHKLLLHTDLCCASGLLNLTCLGIVITFHPMAAAFGQLAVEGSTPEIEGLVMRTFNISVFPIWTTYTLVELLALIATTKFI